MLKCLLTSFVLHCNDIFHIILIHLSHAFREFQLKTIYLKLSFEHIRSFHCLKLYKLRRMTENFFILIYFRSLNYNIENNKKKLKANKFLRSIKLNIWLKFLHSIGFCLA